MLKDVAPGEHTIVATWPDGRTATVTQEVAPGKTITARLSPQ
jgi:hypothetical protein